MNCPECGSEDFETWHYDYGQDQETGYWNNGVRAKCHTCGHETDVEDFQAPAPAASKPEAGIAGDTMKETNRG